MADTLAFTLALIDKISAPAKAASVALGQLEAQLRSVTDLTKRMNAGKAGGSPVPTIPASSVQMIKLTSSELDTLKQRLRDDKLAVTNLTASLKQMREAGLQSTGAMALLEKQIKQKKASLGAMQEKLVLSGHAAEFGSEGTNRLTTTLRELSEGSGAGSAIVALQEAITALSAAIDDLKSKLGQAGAVSKAFGGIVFGAASAIGQKLADSTGEAFVDRLVSQASTLAGEASSALSKRFANQRGIKGQAGTAMANSAQLASEVLGARVTGATVTATARSMGVLAASLASVTAMFVGLAAVAAAVVVTMGLLTVAAGALGVAMVGLTIKGASLAIEAAEAKNDTLDMLEAMLGSAAAANSALDAIRGITNETSASQKAVEDSASALVAAGLENQSLMIAAVRSIAQIDSVLAGKGGKIQAVFEKAAQSGKFELKAKQLAGTGVQIQKLYTEIGRRTGVGVKQVEANMKAGKIAAEVGIAALTKVIDDRFGDLAKKQALDIGPQLQRFKDNVSRLFEDVDSGPFLSALSKTLALVDQATPAGKAMKEVLTTAFDGLFKAAAVVVPYLTAALKGLVIIALRVAIAFKPLMKQLGATFGGEQVSAADRMVGTILLIASAASWAAEAFVSVATNSVVWSTVGYVLKGIAIVAGLVALAFGAAAIAVGLLLAPLGLLITAVVTAIGWLVNLAPAALEAGKNIVLGLAEGIKNAASWLYEAVKNLALGALKKFKSFFGIESPSKEMAKMGGHLSVGLAQGINRSASAPQLALSGILNQGPANQNYLGPATSSAPPKLTDRSGSGSGREVNLNLTIEAGAFVGIRDAEQLVDLLPEMMADTFERAAMQAGVG